ncbi:MAG TPA: BlaI/MecI/CopY family transcriptional regulator [Fimbriimonas sp.]|nr:BlaI/MecI/CopY family transcriptional regulator [Fimbriimonas sp.]
MMFSKVPIIWHLEKSRDQQMKKQDPHSDLSRRERQIMDALYRLGQAPASEIRDAMPDPPSNTAVRTMLTILQEKGHVSFKKDGAKYIYMPTVSRDEVAKDTIDRVVKNFFGGSVERVVSTLLNSKETDLTHEQIEGLKAIIDKARKEGK